MGLSVSDDRIVPITGLVESLIDGGQILRLLIVGAEASQQGVATILTVNEQWPSGLRTARSQDLGAAAKGKREIRLTGIIEAVHSSKVLVPQIFGPGGPLTLTRLIRNGSEVKEGDPIAPTLKASGVFPAMVAGMVDVGEQTGALPEMLI